MKIKRAENRPGFIASVRGIEIKVGDIDEVYIADDQALSEGWLQTLARVVEAMPDDLHKQIQSIDYCRGRWPPNPTWYPGYLIWANPDLIKHAHERQRLSDLFMRIDGGHPGIGWLYAAHPWIDGKCCRPTRGDWRELEPADEIGLWIEPIGWGAGSGGFQCSEQPRGAITPVRFAELADTGMIKNSGTRRNRVVWVSAV